MQGRPSVGGKKKKLFYKKTFLMVQLEIRLLEKRGLFAIEGLSAPPPKKKPKDGGWLYKNNL